MNGIAGVAQRPPTSSEEGGLTSKMGSIQRARERVEAGLPLEPTGGPIGMISESPLGIQPLRPGGRAIKRSPDTQSPVSSPEAQPSPPLLSASKRPNLAAIGAAISKPATFQEWPAEGAIAGSSRRLHTSPTRQDSEGSRLSDLQPPSMPGSSESRASSSDIPSRPNTYASTTSLGQTLPLPWDENLPIPRGGLYAPANTPSQSSTYLPSTNSTSSRQSSSSSAGTIPEFPVPGTIPIPLGTPSLPTPTLRKNFAPPSSRRGYSSYYSVSSFTPIPEEGVEVPRSHVSYASSHAIPSSWGSNPEQDAYVNTGSLDEEEMLEDGRQIKGGSDDEERGLVRHASVGTRHRPSLTTIQSSERNEPSNVPKGISEGTPRSLEELKDRFWRDENSRKSLTGRNAVAGGVSGTALSRGLDSRTSHEGDIPLGYAGSISEEQPCYRKFPEVLATDHPAMAESRQVRNLDQYARASTAESVRKVYGRWSSRDPRLALEAVTHNQHESFTGGMAEVRTPQRIDGLGEESVPAASSSMTSLPDLIRRATTLASVLDKDKRPSSRYDSSSAGDLTSGKSTSRKLTVPNSTRLSSTNSSFAAGQHSGSMTDILASFPPPALNSSRDGSRSRGSRSDSRWPSPLYSTPLHSSTPAYPSSTDDHPKDQDLETKGRRCCGLPLWLVWLLVLGTLVVSAAVTVPVALIVLPRQHHNSDGASLANCQKEKSCLNGGIIAVDGSGCHCSCASGFTGDLCATLSGNGCTTVDITTSDGKLIPGANLGSSIPRLLSIGPATFHIPLNASVLVSALSKAQISCGSENALVTFGGHSERGTMSKAALAPSATASGKIKRQITSPSVISPPPSKPSVVTSNGIVFAPPTATAALAQAPSATPTGTPLIVDEDVLDFARVSVLYILQKKDLDTAVSAQQMLQNFLGANPTSPSTSAGAGITIDFQKFTIDLGGVKVGANS